MAGALAVDVPIGEDFTGMRLARCDMCAVEFAIPMRSPGVAFYRWLVQSGFDYPQECWEWKAAEARISARTNDSHGDVLVVDFGAGGGGFMRRFVGIPGIRMLGLEHNLDVVACCRSEGLEVVDGGWDELALRWPARVDVSTFWHVVEHVDDPVSLLAAARSRLRRGGELFFSVPLTPMSYEHSWPDPFNELPHHLTRWSLRAIHALAAKLDMQAELHMHRAAPLPLRVLKALVLQAVPSLKVKGRVVKSLQLLVYVLRHPIALPREIVRQWRHPRHAGCTLPDAVLVTLKV